jgi:hypothetical protein
LDRESNTEKSVQFASLSHTQILTAFRVAQVSSLFTFTKLKSIIYWRVLPFQIASKPQKNEKQIFLLRPRRINKRIEGAKNARFLQKTIDLQDLEKRI